MFNNSINISWEEIENLIGNEFDEIYTEITSFEKFPHLSVTFIYAHDEINKKYINFIENLKKFSRINFCYQYFNLLDWGFRGWEFQGKNSTWLGNTSNHDEHAVLFFTSSLEIPKWSMESFIPCTIEGVLQKLYSYEFEYNPKDYRIKKSYFMSLDGLKPKYFFGNKTLQIPDSAEVEDWSRIDYAGIVLNILQKTLFLLPNFPRESLDKINAIMEIIKNKISSWRINRSINNAFGVCIDGGSNLFNKVDKNIQTDLTILNPENAFKY